MTLRTAIAASALLTAGMATAQPAPPPAPTTLTVNAEGRVARAPDIAEVSGGVVTMAATASAAMTENANRMAAVVAAVRKAGIADRDIQTSGLNLQPQYKYENNNPPVLTGYQVTNTVSLRIRKLPEAGRLLDTLVSVGANQISGPNFKVEKADAALDEARLAAVATARARAELYARASGMKIRRIASISESGGYDQGPRPMAMTMRSEKMDATSPVEPGEVALTVNVTMVFELE